MTEIPGLTYLDTGFYIVSLKVLAKVKPLPKPGYEKLVLYRGRYWWLARTQHGNKSVWSMRDSGGWVPHGIGMQLRTPTHSTLLAPPTWDEFCNNFALGIDCDCPKCKTQQQKLEREFEGTPQDAMPPVETDL